MATPLKNKALLWASRKRGVKSRVLSNVKPSAFERDDIPDVLVANKIKRGDISQELRLRFYPTIDVDLDLLYAGEMPGNLTDAESRLVELGFRNNPTAYVEVTDEHGPDDGSYSKQFVTEDAGRVDVPQVLPQPALWKRLKEQYHVVVYDVDDKVIFLCHKEISAWLQPARHVWDNETSARIGVRDFRQFWFDEFDEELGDKNKVAWNVIV